MFLDEEKQRQKTFTAQEQANPGTEDSSKRYLVWAIAGLGAIVLVVAAVVIILFSTRPKPVAQQPTAGVQASKQSPATSTAGSLPKDLNGSTDSRYALGTSTANLKAEDLSFGYFYDLKPDNFTFNSTGYNLPINVKTDVANYYDVTRKIDLDAYINQLDKYGYAVIDNPWSGNANDFFSAYRKLTDKQIPAVMTSDFLIYYFQNTLKEVFQEIEKNAFYSNLWDINKKLYDVALAKYKNRQEKVGMANDPILEGDRMELAYFAVALQLLEPTPAQINTNGTLNDDNKFDKATAESYSFNLPSFLDDDVTKEVALIRAGKGVTKSPVMLYDRDYSNFTVPVDYKDNAKLNNFYLTLKWLNTLFPLDYKSEACPDCLLDSDDWNVEFIAAFNIADDLSQDQDLMNQWAIIYKFISFFTGLRQDLTYLHYHDALVSLFGNNYDIDNIFAADNPNRDKNISSIKTKLLSYTFHDIEGAYDRNDPQNFKNLGMRMLQEPYWPNGYLFGQLTGKNMIQAYSDEKMTLPITGCKNDKDSFYRCSGFGLDIINILGGIESSSAYFSSNTNYSLYQSKATNLQNQFNTFDVNTWNNNVYWLTLDIDRNILEYDRSHLPIFTQSPSWHWDSDYNTALGAWVNLQLPEDKLAIYSETTTGGLGGYTACDQYNYIEPNLNLVRVLEAKNDMLVKMMTALKVTQNTNAASVELKELNDKLDNVMAIEKKQLSGGQLSDEDCSFINDFIRHYTVTSNNDKTFDIANSQKTMIESINGVKLLVVVYQSAQKKIMAIGPVFNYSEKASY